MFLIVLMNLTIFSLLVSLTGFSIIFIIPLFILFRFITSWDSGRIMRFFVWIYGKIWIGMITPFTSFRKEGFNGRKITPPCIFVVNHLSFFDVFFLGALPFSDGTLAVRSWPFKMPWYNPFMRVARYLDVEKLGWERTLATSKEIVKNGGGLIFFPEAHRSRDGRLGRFFSGAFKIAVETETHIIPLCIVGTDNLFPPGQFFLKPAHVKLRALEEVSPKKFSGELAHLEMRKAIKQMMNENIREMRSEER